MNRYEEARHFCRLLTEAGHRTMMAGGCVRDRLLGVSPKDYDLATTAMPERAMQFFRDLGYTVIPVGIEHGTISVVTAVQQVEITTLRQDVDCDGRRATVSFSEDFEQDAMRRDFTINALFEDMDGRILDYSGGMADMRDKVLRFVGRPDERIKEDYLRILRYFRFLSRLGWEPDSEQLTAVKAGMHGLEHLSAERIHNEMIRVLMGAHAGKVIGTMSDRGVLGTLFPWYSPSSKQALAQMLTRFDGREPNIYWFILFHVGSETTLSGKKLVREMERLKFSRKGRKAVRAFSDIFLHLNDLPLALSRILHGAEEKMLPLEESKVLFSCFTSGVVPKVLSALSQLIDGLLHRDAPQIPREALMSLAPRSRGKAVELAKIYWYLGLCNTPEQLTRIINDEQSYRTGLCSQDLYQKQGGK